MGKRNASPVIWGFDFQVNAAIILLLDDLNQFKKIKLEGNYEDIEIEYNDGSKLFAQAKSTVKPYDTSNVIAKLVNALKSLSEVENDKIKKLVYITNSHNPFNDIRLIPLFVDLTKRDYNSLPEEAKKIIDDILNEKKISIDKNLFNICYFPFETDDDDERYKIVDREINGMLTKIKLGTIINNKDLSDVWQQYIFRNGSKTDNSIVVSKKELLWSLIVMICDESGDEELNDYDKEMVRDVKRKYNDIICYRSEKFELITQVLSDYNNFLITSNLKNKAATEEFVKLYYNNYSNYLETNENDEYSIILSKLIITRIIGNRIRFNYVKSLFGEDEYVF